MHSVSTALGRVVICISPMLRESWSFTPLQGILPGTSYCAILLFHPPQSASSSFSSSDHPQATITSCIDYRNSLLGRSLPVSVLVPDYPIISTMTRVMSYKSTSDQMLFHSIYLVFPVLSLLYSHWPSDALIAIQLHPASGPLQFCSLWLWSSSCGSLDDQYHLSQHFSIWMLPSQEGLLWPP